LFVQAPRDVSEPDPDYPPGLLDLARPPTLRVLGRLPRVRSVGIVGTRAPSGHAAAFARSLAAELGRAGVPVYSGGAIGIDAAAHRGAVDAGCSTVVVLPGGLHQLYPKSHEPLYAEVLEAGGALVSHLRDHDRACLGSFHARNKVLAACVSLLVVVECRMQSGARSAAGAARALGRPIGVVPHAPWHALGEGCVDELRLGARPVASALDVLRLLGREPAPGQASLFEDDALATLPEPERSIARAVGGGVRHFDGLCEALQRPASEIAPALMALALRGVVTEGAAGLALAPLASLRKAAPP
jgi:DNA processing protein